MVSVTDKKPLGEKTNDEKATNKAISITKDEKMRQQRREAMEKMRRREEKYQKAVAILARIDIWSVHIPPEKMLKLLKACGNLSKHYCPGVGEHLDDTVEDMDDDSFFGSARMEEAERATLWVNCAEGEDTPGLSQSSESSTCLDESDHKVDEPEVIILAEFPPIKKVKEAPKIEEIQPIDLTGEQQSLEPASAVFHNDLLSSLCTGADRGNDYKPVEPALDKVITITMSEMPRTPSPPPKAPSPGTQQVPFSGALFIDHRAKHVDNPLYIVPEMVQAYLSFLTTNQLISRFLRYDYCNRISDKYLLAVVCVYFARSRLPNFTDDAFFKFLYLANETHEDEDEWRYNIIASVYGEKWREHYIEFMHGRLEYWRMLKHETIVMRETLVQLFTVDSDNPIWSRERARTHGGAKPTYIREAVAFSPKGCFQTPEYCACCVNKVPSAYLPTCIRQNKYLPPKKRWIPYGRTPAP